ncbi:hypothetical protein WN51_12149 [Melipona quadrifasciata]|uniref:Uncharacterized protein n=1 Tax=Melipona quadrifasciata TaxID=166423 RepID=A0A0N0BHM9_9HYME|nr:hypothetical protein WN51_12149 [Melipona quadrifasciata]
MWRRFFSRCSATVFYFRPGDRCIFHPWRSIPINRTSPTSPSTPISALVRAVSRRLLATWLSGRGGLGATKSLRNATKLSVERAGTVIDSPRVGRASCGRPEKKKSDQEAASLPRRKQEKKGAATTTAASITRPDAHGIVPVLCTMAGLAEESWDETGNRRRQPQSTGASCRRDGRRGENTRMIACSRQSADLARTEAHLPVIRSETARCFADPCIVTSLVYFIVPHSASIVRRLCTPTNTEILRYCAEATQLPAYTEIKAITFELIELSMFQLVEGRKVYEIESLYPRVFRFTNPTKVQSHKQLYAVHMSYGPLYSDNTLKRLFP